MNNVHEVDYLDWVRTTQCVCKIIMTQKVTEPYGLAYS
jgi:hypothetical protein